MELPKISLSGSLGIEAGDKLTIGDDPTVYHIDAVDKHGDITGFSIVAEPFEPTVISSDLLSSEPEERGCEGCGKFAILCPLLGQNLCPECYNGMIQVLT